MKYKVCDKCGEIVTKTGIISSSKGPGNKSSHFAKCRNQECGKFFSETEYEKLPMKEF